MEKILNELKSICEEYEINSVEKLINSIELSSKNKYIDIAVFGQFKAGKSSFINSLVNKKILPTSVLPATSIITKIIYGENQRITIYFNDKRKKEISENELEEYITENKNPGNSKNVDIALIELPETAKFKGLCFTDTPGLGSVHKNNNETTESTFIETNIAIVCVSAERPLSETDITLFEELIANSYKVICLITKVDLFNLKEISEINDFVKSTLKRKFNIEIEVYNYSTIKETDRYKNIFEVEVLDKLIQKFESEYQLIIKNKLNLLVRYCNAFFEISLKSAQKTEEEKKIIASKIFDEKTNFTFINHEIVLFSTDIKNNMRDKIYNILNAHKNEIIEEVSNQFITVYDSWNGNLYKLTRKYEFWLKYTLSEKISLIADIESNKIESVLEDINKHFNFFSRSFRERLSNNIKTTLGISISSNEWNIEFKRIKRPDISIYRAFDNHLDLLWFIFPMIIFKKLFKKYFLKQIPDEVDKNIHRITSDYTEIINKTIDNLKDETLINIKKEIITIENALKSNLDKSEEYIRVIENLKKISV